MRQLCVRPGRSGGDRPGRARHHPDFMARSERRGGRPGRATFVFAVRPPPGARLSRHVAAGGRMRPMTDIYEAIERLSAELSMRVAKIAGERGWPHKPYSWVIAREDSRFFMVVATTVSLPDGRYASFTPRTEPLGTTW